MPYIPERRFEDKPDTFTPFVPLDPDTVVEICEKHLKKNPLPKLNYKAYILILIVLL
jgi:hypothetical protein